MEETLGVLHLGLNDHTQTVAPPGIVKERRLNRQVVGLGATLSRETLQGPGGTASNGTRTRLVGTLPAQMYVQNSQELGWTFHSQAADHVCILNNPRIGLRGTATGNRQSWGVKTMVS